MSCCLQVGLNLKLAVLITLLNPGCYQRIRLVQEVPHKSISAPGIFPKVSFESSSIEREKSDSQAALASLLVDLNGGSRKELESLPGIGRVLAARIVSYRSIYGGFQDVGDLVNISGIGEKRLRRLEPFVTVQTIVRDIGS